MLTLNIPLDDQLFDAVTTKAKELGLSREAFATEALRAAASADTKSVITFDANVPGAKEYGPYLAAALQRIKRLDDGCQFTLNGNQKGSKRLFSTDEWNKMKAHPGFVPTTFGKCFLQYVLNYNNRYSKIAEPLKDKTSDNKQVYEKVGPPQMSEGAVS